MSSYRGTWHRAVWQISTRPRLSSVAPARSVKGQEEPFPARRLSGREGSRGAPPSRWNAPRASVEAAQADQQRARSGVRLGDIPDAAPRSGLGRHAKPSLILRSDSQRNVSRAELHPLPVAGRDRSREMQRGTSASCLSEVGGLPWRFVAWRAGSSAEMGEHTRRHSPLRPGVPSKPGSILRGGGQRGVTRTEDRARPRLRHRPARSSGYDPVQATQSLTFAAESLTFTYMAKPDRRFSTGLANAFLGDDRAAGRERELGDVRPIFCKPLARRTTGTN
jgi:hypothetical protein